MPLKHIIKKSIFTGILTLVCVDLLFAVVFVIPTVDNPFDGTSNFLFLYVVGPMIAIMVVLLEAAVLFLRKR